MLYYKIKYLCPNIKNHEFVLRNDSDGRGDYIYSWDSVEYKQPTQDELDAISGPADLLEESFKISSFRASEYPPVGDQLDAILKQFKYLRDDQSFVLNDDINNIISSWEAVKLKYPYP